LGSSKNIFNSRSDDAMHYIQRFGHAASIGLLHPLCSFFKSDAVDGIIGYRMERNAAVVIGDPVCAAENRIVLAREFHNFCKAQNKKTMYAMASESFTNQKLQNLGGSALQFGHEIIIDPTIDTRSLSGRHAHQLRQKEKNAVLNGVTVCQYDGNNPEINLTLIKIAADWLENRKGPQVYLLPLDIFAHASNKRWFYAQKDNQIIGFLMLSRMEACGGWILNGSIMLTPQAPSSSSEYLMICALEILRDERHTFFSTGPIISPEIDRIEGFNWFSRMMVNSVLSSSRKIFKMHDRQRYWRKFQPRREPSFLLFNSPRVGISEVRALLRTFNVTI
jgi:lysylphosphatidylglycerol synthetase-like protein (DUF2156 family)